MRAAYYTFTILLAADVALSGVLCLGLVEPIVSTFGRLGLPLALAQLLGVCKLLGAIALFVPPRPTLREWVYAGLVYEFAGATCLHVAAGDTAGNIAGPVVALVLTLVSYALAHRMGQVQPQPPSSLDVVTS